MITLHRELAMALVVISAGITFVGSFALIATALSLRGDVVAPFAIAIAAALCAGVGARGLRRMRTRAADPLRIAHTIANAPRSELPAELRSELLAAVETWWLLDGRAISQPGQIASRELAQAYVQRIDARLRSLGERDPLPSPSVALLWPLALALALAGTSLASQQVRAAVPLLFQAVDGRPEPPRAPLWRSLALTLHYPEHTARPPRTIENPSGSLRVPRGTEVRIDLRAQEGIEALSWVLAADRASLKVGVSPIVIPLQRGSDQHFRGTFRVEEAGTWSVASIAEGDAPQSSRPSPLEIEPDGAPEIELLPLASGDRSPAELDTVELRFRARDDFGFADAQLVISQGDDEAMRIDLGPPPQGRVWNHRYAWDLSKMPLEERTSLEFWIELRDNDPHRSSASAQPGKVTASTRLRLNIRDHEAEHAANIEALRELRDAAVDHLAQRMTSRAFQRRGQADTQAPLDEARALHSACGDLLAKLAECLDRLAVDPLSRERDTITLGAIHGRLRTHFVAEQKLHEKIPIGAEIGAPARARSLLASLGSANDRQVNQLEDEIIRLDDLVDTQIVGRIEELVARVEASQRKLVELLERLQAGDRSVTSQIEQLQKRLRQDMARVQDARAQLHKEVDHDFLNLDAFAAMQARMQHDDLDEKLKRGDVDGALERARERLDDLRGLRDSVQERLADAPQSQVSPQERARLNLLRALSRLQDSERGLAKESQRLHAQRRDQLKDEALDDDEATKLHDRAAAMQREAEAINDARLGRESRSAVGDALAELRKLATARGAIEAEESAAALQHAIDKALEGAEPGEPEAKQLAKLREAAAKLHKLREAAIPEQQDDPATVEHLADLGRRQSGIELRARELLDLPEAEHLSEVGVKAIKSAAKSLQSSQAALKERRTGQVLRAEAEAIEHLQSAIDSLRRTASRTRDLPERTSTASQRDRSLRDDVMEAMREEAPEGYAEPVKRYYEEILR